MMTWSQPPADILIVDARLLRLDAEAGALSACDIAIVGGRIVRIAPSQTISPDDATEVIDANGGIVMPGLVNAHTHSPENIARGYATNARLPVWLNEIWPSLDTLSPDILTLAIELGAAEMIRHGVTAVVDHFRQTPTTEVAVMTAIEAYARTGLRTTIAVMMRDSSGTGGGLVGAGHVKAVPSAVEQVSIVVNAADYAHAKGVSLALGPSAPHRCSDHLLEAITQHSGEFSIHTHVDETRQEAVAAQARFGRSAIAHLKCLGLLGPRTACAHVVHSSPDDVLLLAETGTTAIHNPLANMRLGSGTMDITAFLATGVHVALGTDGAASNDSQNSWEVIKMAALLPRIHVSDEQRWPRAETILRSATQEGHRVTGLALTEPQAGLLCEGAPADLIVFDEDPFAFIDSRRPAACLVLGSADRRPRHVISQGRVLLRDNNLTTIDEDRLRGTFRSQILDAAA